MFRKMTMLVQNVKVFVTQKQVIHFKNMMHISKQNYRVFEPKIKTEFH